MIRRLIVLTLPLTLVAGVACDSSSGLSEADWIKAANAICADVSKKFDALSDDFPTTPGAFGRFFQRVADLQSDGLDRLEELEPPDDISGDVDDAIEAGRAAQADFEEAAEDTDAGTELLQGEGGENNQEFEDSMVELGADECGPDDEEEEGHEEEEVPDPATFSPERQAFVAAGDAICTETNEAIAPLEQEHLQVFPPPLPEWAAFLDGMVPIAEGQLQQFQGLTAPPEISGQWDAFLADAEPVLTQAGAARDAAQAGDDEAFDEAVNPMFQSFEDLDAQLRALGFTVCGAEESDEAPAN